MIAKYRLVDGLSARRSCIVKQEGWVSRAGIRVVHLMEHTLCSRVWEAEDVIPAMAGILIYHYRESSVSNM